MTIANITDGESGSSVRGKLNDVIDAVNGGALIWTTPVDLTANQLNHLSSAPPVLLAAPGAGLVNQIIGAWARFQVGTTQFVSIGPSDPIIAFAGAGKEMSIGEMLYADVDTFMEALAAQERVLFFPLSECENKDVTLSSDGDLAGEGNGTLRISLGYRVVDVS